VVAGFVALVVAVLAFVTLYLPAREQARQGNVVHVQDLTLRLTAGPDPDYPHGVDMELTVDPPLDDAATLDVAPTMPAMANMPAHVTQWWRLDSGAYRVVSDLGMSGPWDVQVTVRRPGLRDAVARFRLNA